MASNITLFVAPFQLQIPFRIPAASAVTASERIDQLVKEVHVQVMNNHLTIPPKIPQNLIIPSPKKWVLFCLKRRTVVSTPAVIDNLCTALANDNSATIAEFVVLPISKIYISRHDTLLETLSKSGLPAQYGFEHATHTKLLQSIPCCFWCKFGRNESRCSSCIDSANRLFHLNQVTCPPWQWTKATSYLHLGLWIPQIAAPCDLTLDLMKDDPIIEISDVIRFLQPKTDTYYTGHDYPTQYNWILLEFATEKQIRKDDFRDIYKQSKSELKGQSKTYAVIPVHCGSLTPGMLKAVRSEGSVGWEKFWQKRLHARVSGRSSPSGSSTLNTPDHDDDIDDASFHET